MPNVQPPSMATLASGLDGKTKDALSQAFVSQDKFSRDVSTALNLALVRGDTLQVLTPYTQAAPLVVPTDWTAVTFANSWVDFDANLVSRYRKDATGQVDVQIRCKSGTAGNAVITTLPAGYRSNQAAMFFDGTGNGAFAQIQMTSGGALNFVVGGSTLDSHAVFSFPADPHVPYVPSCFPFDVAWPKAYPPTMVIAQCAEATNAASPSRFAAMLTDWTTATKGGQTVIRVQNIPGLLPSTNYAVTLVCF